MIFEECNPFVRQALASRLTKNHAGDVFNLIKTVDARLIYIREGAGHMRIMGVPHALAPGTAVLFGPGTGYVWEVEDVGYYVVNFDFTRSCSNVVRTFHPIHAALFEEASILDPVTFEGAPLLCGPIVVQDMPELERELRQIVTEYQIGGPYSQAAASALLKSAIVRILRRASDTQNRGHDKTSAVVSQVIEYIGANYAGDLANETIAAAFHFHPTYLNRIFKACTGQSIHEYVLHYRLNMAMELLRGMNVSVAEAGKRCGFTNPYHFSKAFRRYTGKTPSAYQSGG